MNAVALDTERARARADALIAGGDGFYRAALDLPPLLDSLALTSSGFGARRAAELAASGLWEIGTFLHLVADHAESADSGFGPATLDALQARAAGMTGGHGLFAPFRVPFGASALGGDLGETFDRELRSPFAVYGSTAVDRGRALIARAISDTSTASQIRADEFELVKIDDTTYVVVLPGVADLSTPDLFLSDEHRSVRDLDRYAVPSSRTTSVADNRYASMVWDAIDAAGVPRGSNLLIVGHSFGADTALDLAADPLFNGAGGYSVTHVVAAGYHSQPQLAHVPPATEVLVLQNHRDAAVVLEGFGHSEAAKTVEASVRHVDRLLDRDLVGAAAAGWDAIVHQTNTVIGAGGFVVDHADDLGAIAGGIGTGDWATVAERGAGLVTLDPRVERVGDHAIVDVFEGGSAGAGHHPANYVEHLDTTDDELVLGFLASVATAGYARSGSVVAVDVSVPR